MATVQDTVSRALEKSRNHVDLLLGTCTASHEEIIQEETKQLERLLSIQQQIGDNILPLEQLLSVARDPLSCALDAAWRFGH
jgi:hypothetical protein